MDAKPSKGDFSLPSDSPSLVGKLAQMFPPVMNPAAGDISSEEARLRYMEQVGARKVIDFLLEHFPQRGPK